MNGYGEKSRKPMPYKVREIDKGGPPPRKKKMMPPTPPPRARGTVKDQLSAVRTI